MIVNSRDAFLQHVRTGNHRNGLSHARHAEFSKESNALRVDGVRGAAKPLCNRMIPFVIECTARDLSLLPRETEVPHDGGPLAFCQEIRKPRLAQNAAG